jgi:hypothetical protein
VVFGARGDKTIEEFLKSPGAIEQFQHTKGEKKAEGASQTSPLVKQAQAFALYLNPPPPPEPIAPSGPQPPRPKVTAPKFKLVGTSFYPLHPDLSLALIDEPGKGIRWVRQLEQIGHLVIEQVKDGIVVVNDGGRTFEVAAAERPQKINLVKSSTLDINKDKTATNAVPQPAGQVEADLSAPAENAAAEQINAEESADLKAEVAAMDDLVRKLKAAEANEELTEEDKKANAEFEKFVESIRVSAEEAKKLDKLGKDLQQNGGTEPNLVKGAGAKVEHRPRLGRR